MTALEVRAEGAAAEAVAAVVPVLVGDSVASRIAAQDATLWGKAAEEEASVRLGWVSLATASRPLVEQIAELREDLRAEGVDRVVLCGMGGSSLAPEVITRTAGVELTVLDGTDPGQVRRALDDRLDRTVVVVSSKSGNTVETDSQRRAFADAFTRAGIDAARRIVVVTDPGSPLEAASKEAGYRAVFAADPTVGGRYSALTAFGLVPCGLAGVDIGGLLDEAEEAAEMLAADDEGNPALVLGAAIAGGASARGDARQDPPARDKVIVVEDGTPLVGFGDWAEQLVAESTGKEGTGVLPVVVGGAHAPEVASAAADATVVRLVADDALGSDHTGSGEGSGAQVRVAGPLGAQFLLWEYATAVASRLLGINPFDQPDVESAKKATRALLDERGQTQEALFTDAAVEVRAVEGLLPEGETTLAGALEALLGRLDPQRGYIAVMAYLDREADTELAELRELLARRTSRPVTFGWGPRFLHSTGQYHKGGPATGVYLQVTGAPVDEVPIPGIPFSFGELIAAQAAGDASVLAEHGRPVLRVHLADRRAGIAQLLAAVRSGATGSGDGGGTGA
ncbi:glucose-6-phosphate isomerase [Kineococcus xinjiangensis]|uniref:Glucose-6-phosphate isomerase n=1 Tax=Kineococcus xinjiangensis TaxID=512762 RepID=A0A2S6IPJ6_9ACTN|nr:glucose-6-phosphate isomerase [Kineococcus xinjiangensis]PPK96128.1 glucose-6-phosphate isomerase [Kineococcus xinjiangensis]